MTRNLYILLITITVMSFKCVLGQSQVDYSPDPSPQAFPNCIDVDFDNINQFSSNISAETCIQFNSIGHDSTLFIEESTGSFNAEAGRSIHLRPDMHIKSNSHLRIDQDTDFKLVWYAPNSVGTASHYNKMEIGAVLSNDIMNEIDHFFDNDEQTGKGLNPFNRHDINFQMTFFYNGNPVDRSEAFYYTPQKIENNEMIDDTTSFPFRFRHSPRFLGDYMAKIQLFVSGVLLKEKQIQFEVIPSNNKGYLEVGENKRHLRLAKDKESFFGIGQVIPWALYPSYGNWNIPADFQRLSTEMEVPLEVLNDAGGNFTRIVAAPWSLQMEVESLGNYHTRRNHAWYLDKLADFCVDEEVYFLYCMRLHSDFTTKGDWDKHTAGWESSVYNTNRLLPNLNASETIDSVFTVSDFYTRENAKDHYKNFLRYLVSRYGYATSLAGWQLVSEADDTGSYRDTNGLAPIARTELHSWTDEMCKYLYDGVFDRHMRSACIIGDGDNSGYTDALDINIYNSEYIDYVGIHTYTVQNIDILAPTQDSTLQWRNRNIISLYEAIRNLGTGSNGQVGIPNSNLINRPFIFDEFGTTPLSGVEYASSIPLPTDIPGEYNQCDPNNFHNELWSTFCGGAAVSGLDWWIAERSTRQQMWYDNFYGIKEFAKDIDFENVNYSKTYLDDNTGLYYAQRWPWKVSDIQATNFLGEADPYLNKDAIEGLMMLSSDRKQGFGWAHNRSHNWQNLLDSNNCHRSMSDGINGWQYPSLYRTADDDVTNSVRPVDLNKDYIKLRNVKLLRKYVIEFYDPLTNQLLDTIERVSNANRKLKIKIPVISVKHQDIAFKFYLKQQGLFKSNESDSIIENDKEVLTTEIGNNLILIYPNPNNGQFSIGSEIEIETLVILDTKGNIVYSNNYRETRNVTIDLDLAIGIYYLRIETKKGIETRKITIHK